jgi:hypothetical protein
MIPALDRQSLKLVIGIAAALMLALLINDRNRWKSTAALRQQQVAAEKAAHSATVANYRAAAEQARRGDAANAARVKASQAAINERTKDAFESRIAAARAHAGRLRLQAGNEADPRSGAAAPVPRLPAAAGGASQAAGEDGFSRSERLIATEQAIQLDELIKWVKRQAAIPPNGESEGRGGEGLNASE